MGVCCSRKQRKDQNINAPEPLELEIQSPLKILLLGAGETGKSTLFKQIGALYGLNPLLQNGDDVRKVIRKNIIESMTILAKHADLLDDGLETKIISQTAKAAKVELMSIMMCWDNNHSGENLESDRVRGMVVEDLKCLWREVGIHKTLQLKHLFSLSFDNLPYFMDKIEQVFSKEYLPSVEDVMRSRTRTTGINEVQFDVNSEVIEKMGMPSRKTMSFRLIDVGGQRGERRKWLNFLGDVDGIIFMSSISAYDEVMFEDETRLRLHEDLSVFDKVCQNSWTKPISILLLLNKKDVFERKFELNRFQESFPNFTGNSWQEAVRFLQHEFESKDTRRRCLITSKSTCVLDASEVNDIFHHLIEQMFLKKTVEEGNNAL